MGGGRITELQWQETWMKVPALLQLVRSGAGLFTCPDLSFLI